FQKFWENAIRWLIQDPSQRLLSVRTDAAEYPRSAKVRIDVRLLGADYQPHPGAAVAVAVMAPPERPGATPQVVTSRNGRTDEEGEVALELTPRVSGPYRVSARAQVGGRPIEEHEVFLVRAEGRELDDVQARPELLQAVAAASGGSFDEKGGSRLDRLALID